MSELAPLQSRLNALIAQLSAQQRSALMREVGQKLAQSQRLRIAKQQNPDGTPYEPRKPQKRSPKGRIKQAAMFRKLRTTKCMRRKSNANSASVGFEGANASIARIHQEGGWGRVNRRSERKVKYAQRELLGFSDRDVEMIEELVVAHLAKG